jgi:hypothetical protein
MRRRVYLLGVGLALVALGLAVTDAVMGPSPKVTEANARRIRSGMTMREVEAILGSGGVCLCDGTGAFYMPHPYLWTGPGIRVIVTLASGASEEDGLVQRVVTNGVAFHRTASPGPLARLRARLGW